MGSIIVGLELLDLGILTLVGLVTHVVFFVCLVAGWLLYTSVVFSSSEYKDRKIKASWGYSMHFMALLLQLVGVVAFVLAKKEEGGGGGSTNKQNKREENN